MPDITTLGIIYRVSIALLLLLLLAIAGIWFFGEKQLVPEKIAFTPKQLPRDLEQYLETSEAAIPNLKPDNHKRIIWASRKHHKTNIAIIYIHGFSSSPGELRPVPDNIAKQLNANVFLTRLTGHGRSDDALADVHVESWLRDLSDAIAIATRLGRRIVVIGTSTGGTLASTIPLYPRLEAAVDAIVFISPNFGTQNRTAAVAGWPGADLWLPLVAGRRLKWDSKSAAHSRYWTLDYKPQALIPMVSLVNSANQADLSQTDIPALFVFSEQDKVVRPELTHAFIKRWGKNDITRVYQPKLTEKDDTDAHVIAGDVQSPNQNAIIVDIISNWIAETLNISAQ